MLSVVMPIYNEEGILWQALVEFADKFNDIVGKDNWQYILVENGSTDNSLDIVKRAVKKWPKSKLVKLDAPNYGNALRSGMLESEGEFILIMNVDHLWDAPYFQWCWENRNDYDMIMGSKSADPTLNKQSDYRRVLSTGLNALLRFFFGFIGTDTHGMKFMRTETILPIARICVMRRGQFDTELNIRSLRAGHYVVEVPIPYEEKRNPRNFMFKKIKQNVIDLLTFYQAMKNVPYEKNLHYRRLCREDIINNRKVGLNGEKN